jgi:predicted TIM-barrel fold metal-dependent hydrolase
MKNSKKKIDVQHHIIPRIYVEKLASVGINDALGVPFPKWNPETSLAFMKKMNIDVAVMSISSPGVCFQDERFSKELARSCNEHMAEVKKSHPKRFGGFAAIPLEYPETSLDEIRYALDDLALDGIGLLSQYGGRYLGDERFEEVMAELNRRKAVVFIHPSDPADAYDPKLGIANALIESAFETTRTVANLLYTGTADRYPDIQFILAHGGGTIPFLSWRMALIEYAQKDQKTPVLKTLYDLLVKGAPEAGLKILRNMYVDTGLTSGPAALKALQEFPGPSRIVFGSDFPFAKVAPIVAKNLEKDGDFTDTELEAIFHGNCRDLFPQFR